MSRPSVEDVLDDLDTPAPQTKSSLDDVRAWLEAVRDRTLNASEDFRALVREGVIDRLGSVEAVGAAARLADAYLYDTSADGADSGLQGTALTVEDPKPWPGDVDGAELVAELARTFTRYLALPEGAAPTLALWTLHAHAHDAAQISPVLAITSPEKRCGKTTLLDLLSALVPRPLPASNLTPATVFRTVERWQPTLLVDEADTYLKEGSELRGVLNSGHRRSMASVPRCVGDDHEVRQFRTWSPKAVALIGDLPDTLADRSIEIRMRRRTPDEEVERLRLDHLEELNPLRRIAWTWTRKRDIWQRADPDLPEGLHDRQRDNWRPLILLADLAGGPWPKRARKAAQQLTDDAQDDRSVRTRLLRDVRRILQDHHTDRIRSKVLVKRLRNLEEAPWSEYKRGQPLTPVSLANLLRPFDVSSEQIRFESGSYKGYKAAAFEDAFQRYLDTPSSDPFSHEAETPKQHQNNRDSDGSRAETSLRTVSGREFLERPDDTGIVSGVSGRRKTPDGGDGRAGRNKTCQTCRRPIGPTAEVCGRCKSEREVEDRC